MGGSKSSGGGQQSSGKVKFPSHLWSDGGDDASFVGTNFAERFMYNAGAEYDVTADVAAAKLVNPYITATIYDPTTVLATLRTRFATFDSLVVQLEDALSWAPLVSQVTEALDATPIGDGGMEDVIDAAIAQRSRAAGISQNRLYAGAQDILSALMPAFTIADSMLADGNNDAANATRNSLRMSATGKRTSIINEAVSDLVRNILRVVQANRSSFSLRNQVEKLGLVYDREVKDRNILLQEHAASWNLELWQYGANLISGLFGGGGQVREEDFGLGRGSALRGELGNVGVGGYASGGF